MKVAFYIISFFLIIACNPSNMTCGEIDSKYEKNGEYFFALVLASNGGNNEAGRIYGDVSVEKSVYLLKDIGDEYCMK